MNFYPCCITEVRISIGMQTEDKLTLLSYLGCTNIRSMGKLLSYI